MFCPPEQYPFTSLLEAHWRRIRQELDNLNTATFTPWPERFLYGSGWDVFGFYAFGKKLDMNCRLCPETTGLIEQIPGLVTAGFSSLAPGTHISPHVGYTNAVLRCHLGLIVPEGCKMRVGSETREWQEGKCLVFDDTTEHEVWHNGDRLRVILLLDFKRTEDADVTGAPVPEAVAQKIRQIVTGS